MDPISAYLVGFLVLLLFTAFVKIATALTILRLGIGLDGVGFGFATAALALALSWVVMSPYLDQAGGINNLFSQESSIETIDQTFRPFLIKHADAESIEKLSTFATREVVGEETEVPSEESSEELVEEQTDIALSVLSSAFLMSELKIAFQVGVLLLLPFVVIDLLVVNILSALGVQQISATVVSFPMKILLFLAVDGWSLIVDKLLSGYV